MIIYELLFLYACDIDYIYFLYTTKMSSRTLRFLDDKGVCHPEFFVHDDNLQAKCHQKAKKAI